MNTRTLIAALTCALVVGPAAGDEKRKPVEPPKGTSFVKLTTAKPAAAGFVLPGSRVDVYFKLDDPKTALVLESLLVYAVEADGTDETTYTVALDKPRAAAVAAFTGAKAEPLLVLRKPDGK